MKLIDILVQELPKSGGWLEGYDVISTNGYKNVWAYKTKGAISGRELHIRSETEGHVTREQYEAALAASKQAWDGVGLPTVGCRVEVKADDFEGGWLVIDVAYVHNGEVIGIVQSENEYINDRLEKFSAGYNRAEFRPIRSEADKKKEAAIAEIVKRIGITPESAATCYEICTHID